MEAVDEAVFKGARVKKACDIIGISPRTLQRWKRAQGGEDGRKGPRHQPRNALSKVERARVMSVVNSPEYQGMSPKQIVPKLADQGIYVASESTIYRLLRELGQVQGPKTPRSRVVRTKPTQTADGPNQVWSWDITYLKSSVKGQFFYLYLVVDIWSRKIMGWDVLRREGAKHAAELISRICDDNDIDGTHLVLHSDNGAPMKGATMLATLQWLGVVPSFSRPHVKDDNAYSESLFRTLKYRPSYPYRPFQSLKEARKWVDEFVRWYNNEHQHSAIRFVTPADRHAERDVFILEQRNHVYDRARRLHPSRWTGSTRDWSPIGAVYLNPDLEATEHVPQPLVFSDNAMGELN